MAESRDLYGRLGLSKGASADEIKKAYRTLARKWHPDVNPGPESEQRFKEISVAYDVLSDPDRRKLYDEFGDAGLREGFDPEVARAHRHWQSRGDVPPGFDEVPFDLGDLESFFRREPRRRRPARGDDLHAVVELDLAEALRGSEIRLQVPDPAGGTPATVTVRIPPGADSGDVLTVKGRGLPGPAGGPPGDVVIETRVRPHPHFERDGLDLSLKLPVTWFEAYAGATVDVPTLEGSVKLKIPPRSQTGSRLRLKGKGVARKGKRGDLYAELVVRVPDRADEQLLRALERTSDLYEQPVRAGVSL
jgi:curved DNA-binding protein